MFGLSAIIWEAATIIGQRLEVPRSTRIQLGVKLFVAAPLRAMHILLHLLAQDACIHVVLPALHSHGLVLSRLSRI